MSALKSCIFTCFCKDFYNLTHETVRSRSFCEFKIRKEWSYESEIVLEQFNCPIEILIYGIGITDTGQVRDIIKRFYLFPRNPLKAAVTRRCVKTGPCYSSFSQIIPVHKKTNVYQNMLKQEYIEMLNNQLVYTIPCLINNDFISVKYT